MPAIIFRVNPRLKENWTQAIRTQLWDTRTNVKQINIESGTDIFFWMNGQSGNGQGFVGRATAISSLFKLTEKEKISSPWAESEEEKRKYQFRVLFDNVDTDVNVPAIPAGETMFQQLEHDLGKKLGQGDIRVEDHQIPLIHDKFFSAQWRRESVVEQLLKSVHLPPGKETEVKNRAVRVRTHQDQFRAQVRRNHSEKCAVTGENVGASLDAAHIIPIGTEEHTNRLSNGILLRADIHRLFDAHLLTFVVQKDEVICRVAPTLKETSYCGFDGKPINRGNTPPDSEALAQHNSACGWVPSEG